MLLRIRPGLMLAFAAISPLVFGSSDAGAVSREVRQACRQDYFDFCNRFEVGSPALRQCMRRNKRRLSDGCVSALVASGEATPAERARARIARRNRESSGDGPRTRRD